MKLNGRHNFITDKDINITGTDVKSGNILSSVVSSHERDIETLKGNVKWLYKNKGTGNGGGGGSTSSGSFSVGELSFLGSKGNIDLKLKDVVINEDDGIYNVRISINNSLNHLFLIRCSTPFNNTLTTRQVNLPSQGLYFTTIPIECRGNGTITIFVYDQTTGNNITYDAKFISSSYKIEMNLVNDNNVKIQNSAFINTVNKEGLNLLIKYNIYIPFEKADFTYKINDKSETITVTENLEGTILIPMYEKDYFSNMTDKEKEDESKNIQVSLKASIEKKITQSIEELRVLYYNSSEKGTDINFTLIPNTFFIACRSVSKGSVYSSIPEGEDFYKYLLISNLNPIIYNGPNASGNSFLVYYKFLKYEEYLENPNFTIDDQNAIPIILTENSTSDRINLTTSERGWFVINFLCLPQEGGASEIYRKQYYIYFDEQRVLDYFRENKDNRDDRIDVLESYYFRTPYVQGETFSRYLNNINISQRSSENKIEFNNLSYNGYKTKGTCVSFGIQYSEINSENIPLITIHPKSNTLADDIVIYQDKIVFGTNKNEIFIPKTKILSDLVLNDENKPNYHLLSIFTREISDDKYEYVVYIDGVAEAICNTYLSNLNVSTITLHPANYKINLIDVSYINPHNELYFLSDLDATNFWYAYKLNILGLDVDNDYNLLVFLYNYSIDSANHEWINIGKSSNNQFLYTAQINSGLPNMILSYNLADDKASNHGSNFNIINYIDASYKQDATNADDKFPVKVQYFQAGSSTSSYSSTKSDFSILLQGSSTKENKAKNFELYINQSSDTESNYINLFTPNYDPDDPNSFLPETSFTLKADVVDSSHSNNTTMGHFINETVSSLPNAATDKHVKKCLEGFPILLYLEINETLYYLGIYNFNLGRNSYFNLGYYDNEYIKKVKENIHQSRAKDFSVLLLNYSDINVTSLNLKLGLMVSEIQDGDPYHDFSQYNSSILFGENANKSMFGDYVPSANITNIQTELQKFVKKITYAGGYIFKLLKKKFGPHEELYLSFINNDITVSANLVPECNKLFKRFNKDGKDQYELLEIIKEDELVRPTNLSNLLTYDETTGNTRSLLNYRSCVEYYTLCQAFGLVDSVEKNLNLKSFDGGQNWSLAFYDMDTCLGRDNQGDKVIYFAFSDYWKEATENDQTTDSNIITYQDFYPNRTNNTSLPIGFDIPSSYLFAIAKYAHMFSTDTNVKDFTPNEFWAELRSNGKLKNAETFVNNYFSKKLENVNEALFNLNYRTKYMRSNGSKPIVESKKLVGKGVHRVKDWMNGRLHILDAYFNLVEGLKIQLKYRDRENNWVPINDILFEPRVTKSYPFNSNEDIIILQSIFDSVAGSTDIDFDFKAKKYSPLIFTDSSGNLIERYLVTDPSKLYHCSKKATGNQILRFGGSENITYISNMATFIDSQLSSLNVNSNSLENLILNDNSSAGLRALTALTVKAPSLREVKLNGREYNATFEAINNGDKDPFPNLTSVDISNSKMRLQIKNEPLLNLKIDNVNNSEGLIEVEECLNLKDLDITGTRVYSILISPTPEKIELRNTHISKMTFTAKQINNSNKITINNDDEVTNIKLSSYHSVNIANCPNITGINLESCPHVSELSITSCTNIETLDLSECEDLRRINVSGCTNLSQLILPSSIKDKIELLDISSTKIDHLDWDFKGERESYIPGVIDLRGATTLIDKHNNSSSFVCTYNNQVEYVKLPNEKSSDSKYLVDNLENAVKVGSFQGCTKLKRIYGNFIITSGSNTFNGCTSFSIHDNSKYGSVYTNSTTYMPYWVNNGTIPSTNKVAKSHYLQNNDGERMDVLFLEGEDATNMSFADNITQFYNTFTGTKCSEFDIYYFFSNCAVNSEKKDRNISFDNTFKSLNYNKSVFGSGFDRYMLHNIKGNITKFVDVFSGLVNNEICIKVPSGTESNQYKDSWYYPLYEHCKEFNRASDSLIWLIDNNLFRGPNNTNPALTTLSGFDKLILHDGLDTISSVGFDNQYGTGIPAQYNFKTYSKIDGKCDTLLKNCGNLEIIKDSFLNNCLFINFSTLKLPDSLKTIINSFRPRYATGIIKLSDVVGDKEISGKGIFGKNNNINSITSSFVIENTHPDIDNTKFVLDNDTFKGLPNLTTINYTVSGEMNYSVLAQLDKGFSGAGLVKTIDCANFPDEMFKYTNILKVSHIFSNVKDSSGTNSEKNPVNLPGNLFKGTELISFRKGFFDLGIYYRLEGGGFDGAEHLTEVDGIFANTEGNLYNSKLVGCIPTKLFYKSSGTAVSSIKYAFAFLNPDVYVNENPTDQWDYDGFNGFGKKEYNDAATSNSEKGSIYNLVMDESSYEEDKIVYEGYIYKNSLGNYDTVLKSLPTKDGKFELDYHYCCAPDLIKNCASTVSVDGLFYGCGVKTIGISAKQSEKRNFKWGLKGRIPAVLLLDNPGITSILNMFLYCKGLSYYIKDEKDEKAYIIPENFFKNSGNISNLEYAFASMYYPYNISFKDIFTELDGNKEVNATGLFAGSWWGTFGTKSSLNNNSDDLDNSPICELNDTIFTNPHQISKMFCASSGSGATVDITDRISYLHIKFGNNLFKNKPKAKSDYIFYGYSADTVRVDNDLIDRLNYKDSHNFIGTKNRSYETILL